MPVRALNGTFLFCLLGHAAAAPNLMMLLSPHASWPDDAYLAPIWCHFAKAVHVIGQIRYAVRDALDIGMGCLAVSRNLRFTRSRANPDAVILRFWL